LDSRILIVPTRRADAPGTLPWAYHPERPASLSPHDGGAALPIIYPPVSPSHVALHSDSARYQGNGYFLASKMWHGRRRTRPIRSPHQSHGENAREPSTTTIVADRKTSGTFYSMQKSYGSVLMLGVEPVGLSFPSNDISNLSFGGGNIYLSFASDLGTSKAGSVPDWPTDQFFFAPSVSSITIAGRDGCDQLGFQRFDDYIEHSRTSSAAVETHV